MRAEVIKYEGKIRKS
ncbi:hypothetical protein [Parasutterella excrementihominis]